MLSGDAALRLPRAADLLPPELGRRLLRLAPDDPVTPLPARRIAGLRRRRAAAHPVRPGHHDRAGRRLGRPGDRAAAARRGRPAQRSGRSAAGQRDAGGRAARRRTPPRSSRRGRRAAAGCSAGRDDLGGALRVLDAADPPAQLAGRRRVALTGERAARRRGLRGGTRRGSCSCPSAAGSPGGCSTAPPRRAACRSTVPRGRAVRIGTPLLSLAVRGGRGGSVLLVGTVAPRGAGAGRRRAVGARRDAWRPRLGGEPVNDVIVTRGLVKRFGRVTAVAGVDLRIPAGIRFGLLGPNGSGKTTLVRMLLGLVHATAGEVELLGEPMPRHAARVLPRVGALVEGPAAWANLSGRANLRLLDAAGPGRGRGRRQRVDEALERVGLGGIDRRPVRAYSLGMRQRLGIAAALLRAPGAAAARRADERARPARHRRDPRAADRAERGRHDGRAVQPPARRGRRAVPPRRRDGRGPAGARRGPRRPARPDRPGAAAHAGPGRGRRRARRPGRRPRRRPRSSSATTTRRRSTPGSSPPGSGWPSWSPERRSLEQVVLELTGHAVRTGSTRTRRTRRPGRDRRRAAAAAAPPPRLAVLGAALRAAGAGRRAPRRRPASPRRPDAAARSCPRW